jgi:hypothetical protein
MGKSQSYSIAGEFFKTKGALQDHIRQILYRYVDLQYLSQEDFGFMLEVLKLHPNSDIKIGVGAKAMYVKQNPIYRNTRGFWVVREDNSETDFSFFECLKETPHEKRFMNACRVSVEPYTIDFKNKFFSQLQSKIGRCPITGKTLTFTSSHVDHIAPNTFQNIVSRFIAELKINVSQVKINGKGEDGIFQDTFDDKELEKTWVEYHNAHAKLQIVSPGANLSILKTMII